MRQPAHHPDASIPAQDDAALVRAVLAGDLSGFETLVQRYHPSLCAFLFRITGRWHEAEELAQDAFVKAFQELRRFNPRHAFKTWLYTIGRNLALDTLRKRQASPLDELSGDEPPPETPAEPLADDSQRRQLLEALETLPDPQRQALWLFHADELPVNEIAAILGKSGVATRVLLFRARHTLASRLRTSSRALAGEPAEGDPLKGTLP